MPFLTMIFLYVTGSLIFAIGAIGAITSLVSNDVAFSNAFRIMLASALVLSMGAIIQVLREIASNTRNRTSL